MLVDRRVVRFTPDKQQIVGELVRHRDDIYRANERLISPHTLRVASLAAPMSVKLEMIHEERLKVIEGSLLHDVGKLHRDAEIWLKANRGLTVSDHERIQFRGLHSELGKVMLAEVNFSSMRSSREEMETICLRHNEPYHLITGHLKQVIGVIQVADFYDARTSGEGDHTHAKIPEADAIRFLYSRAASGCFDPACVDALVFSCGLG
jgi:HD-GYP domain-containing protein (c-di-GMP phosphodiesterase class II)